METQVRTPQSVFMVESSAVGPVTRHEITHARELAVSENERPNSGSATPDVTYAISVSHSRGAVEASGAVYSECR